MKISFNIDADSLTVEDMLMVEDVQEGKRMVHNMTSLLARHMADENGDLLGEARAMEIIRPMTITELGELAKGFGEAIQRKAVPPPISAR